MARQVVVVVAEGESDHLVLEAGLTPLFAAKGMDVRVIVVGADVSSDKHVNTTNIHAAVNAVMGQRVLDTYGLKRSNIVRVLHVMDADGAFVDDSHIVENPNQQHFVCGENSITGKSRDLVASRNKSKRANMRFYAPLQQ